MTRRPLDRRSLLRGGLVAASGLALASRPGALAGTVRVLLGGGDETGTRPGDGTLVLVQLSGGNDGLSTVVPYEDDFYGRSRRTTRLGADDVHRIADGVGLHPALGGLREVFEAGRLAVVQGVGYPEPSRSHFESLDVWHAATPDGRPGRSGWIGRLAEELAGEPDPTRVVHLGTRVPFSVCSATHPPTSFTRPDGYRFAANEDVLRELASERVPAPARGSAARAESPALARLREAWRDAARSSAAVREAAEGYRTDVDYPREPLAGALRTAASLLKGGLGCRVVSVEHAGYDTHVAQRGVHDRRMAELDGALAAFLRDLEGTAVGRRTAVLVFSEFGRRVTENGSRGTDHGTAGPVLLAGELVRGGLHGEAPPLDRLEGGDLVHTTDFRSVYASALDALFAVAPDRVLGAPYPELRLFAGS